ncbi:MAG: F0F1 ATP synthase subunit A [Desulfatibacillum sp.]|nr:F0F1 ATP synthase subunit A [Desulfatibacillum sp.]
MNLSPDSIVYWQSGFVVINATLVFTWAIMLFLVIFSWTVTRNLSTGEKISKKQNLLESIVGGVLSQIQEIEQKNPKKNLPLVGTLFIFIAISNVLTVVPGFQAPTGSLSTTTALALWVFVAIPVYGIGQVGFLAYMKNYFQPSPLMLPFNVMGEVSRILALAVRLFGNIMSGSMIGMILLSLAPIIFPIIMQLFGLLTGLVQAYIFAVLAAVYLAAAAQTQQSNSP